MGRLAEAPGDHDATTPIRVCGSLLVDGVIRIDAVAVMTQVRTLHRLERALTHEVIEINPPSLRCKPSLCADPRRAMSSQ